MPQDNYWLRRARAGRVTRRRFVGGTAVAGVGAAAFGLVGCGDDDDDDAEPTATAAGGATPGATTAASPTTAVDAPIEGGVLVRTLGATQFDSVDLHRAQRDEVGWLTGYTLNKIVRFSNPDAGDIEGDLSEKWETPDAQTYTFSLRKDVKWQTTPITNGRQFTAADIKWHIERQAAGLLLDGTAASFRFKSDWVGVKVETPDDYTVKLTLPRPNGAFMSRLAAFFAGVPNREATEKFEGTHNTLTPEAQPATSAFMIHEWTTGKDIILKKNPEHFRKGEPHVDGIIYPWGLFQDPNAYRLAFEQKQVDGWSSPDASVTKAVVEANKGMMTETLSGVSNTVLLHLNMNKQFKDVRLVRAVNMAYDRRAQIEAIHQGLGQVSGPVTWLQEGWAVKPEDLIKHEGYRIDRDLEIKEARALWEAGGGPALGDVDIKVEASFAGLWPDMYAFVPKMLNDALGVSQFKSSRTTYNEEIIPNLLKGEYPNWVAWTNAVDNPDPRVDIYGKFNSAGTQNWSKVNNAELDKLLNDALLTADTEKAKASMLQAQDILLKNGQFGACNLYNYISRGARWNYLHATTKDEVTGGKSTGGFWNTAAGNLEARYTWINSKDPSYGDAVKNRKLP